ncbi:Asp-tRNA(Asn)/Glu-tRNA(Gln) amidotransferase subunit GatA [Legionella oakridgensis]|uniref:Glutamyl-tRNA(Gln) amidotransferase subunit A n=2 Tax=Legionella oakridgensis TaxID=29423 RepID=W0B9U0_9GAMM|nr:Asp-tRNA(Asn)/Glu-tRNA(Gln) amidotransferase subunit GatA [Legionella oakridgensis]AHE67283.1 aspartyl/glutamyl-tRNAAsn/Gln amidotransferase, A subunit [Legionella oakridgensis ATCC 33761 = DSM 21215]ETO93112.1 aspartyl/glutamyl-tRNA(Asn/Gln) amidotransferase, subunit A [Legionella oakridgensis RV-2-2007]KTD37929.1 aspartyl/glutamyl-tRNA amidotransferase subunit A [Legionella oakridgensis]STY20350.1 aspartyl/glutamyl-tRNA amidotransferase subunit A [Legionella longbeachae]
MHTKSIRELSHALHHKELSSVELTQHYLKRIELNHSLNSFIHINEQHAISAAEMADKLLHTGNAKPLTGIPLAHKDIFCTQIMPTTCGSKMLANFQSPYQATIVQRLAAQGTVLIGKTNMDEFAMGSANENSYFGVVKNPWNQECVPGGSSGGSAAAVAASLVPFATGSDTGGSIRQPAAFCGISGLKPTYGLLSRFGMVAFASSLDQAGPMARSAEDLAFILQVLAGHDEKDSTSINKPIPDYIHALDTPFKPCRIGLPSCFFQPEVDADIQQAIMNAVDVFKKAGCEIIEVDLSLQSLWVPCYYVIACAEASSNLSRYDGIRFGYRTPKADNLFELITRSRNEGFGLEVKRRILTGTYVLSSGYFDDYYVQAQKVRRMIQEELLEVLTQVEIILGPTTPTCAFKLGEKVADPTQRYLADVFTVAANLAGLPGLSIPAGFNHEGLPIGLQLMGTHFSETRLLSLAHFYQRNTDWHQARPKESI